MMQLAHKNTLVVGLGITGLETAKFLNTMQARVTVTDTADEEQLLPFLSQLSPSGIRLELGEHKPETFEKADLIVISPGVPHTIKPINKARAKGIPVIGEIELAARFIRKPIIAVTGTNGKTTTTALLGQMLTESGFNVFVGGNIGNPLIGHVHRKEQAQVVVAEISSFQLDTIVKFRPKIGVLLNIADDHLDRYADIRDYASAKLRIFENQTENDTAILNRADPHIRMADRRIKSQKIYFNAAEGTESGAIITKDHIIFRFKATEMSIDRSAVNLLGRHNAENVAAAGVSALAAGGSFKGLQKGINTFKSLSHRLQYVDTINKVRYFNDSKATNISAVAGALRSFKKPVVLILGGQNKGGDFGKLKKLIRTHTKKLIIMGEASHEIESILGPVCPGGFKLAASMEDAVFLAHRDASVDDVILLSPGCASFDMYSNYAHRGDAYCQAVDLLKNKFLSNGKNQNRT